MSAKTVPMPPLARKLSDYNIVLVFLTIVTFFAIFHLINTVNAYFRQEHAKLHWIQVPCVIVNIENGSYGHKRIKYVYKFDELFYSSNRYSFYSSQMLIDSSAKVAYPINGYIDPNNPANAVINIDDSMFPYVLLDTFGILFTAGYWIRFKLKTKNTIL